MASLRNAALRLVRSSPSAAAPVRALSHLPSSSVLSTRYSPSVCHAAATLGSRFMHTTTPRSHGGKGRPAPGTGIMLTFKKANGEFIETVEANEGDDIVDVSWEYDLDIEAACEKSIACSTCHVILEEKVYDTLEEPSDDENDMLDMAFALSDTSRLGCQVKVTKAMHGSTITLPSATRNLRVDGSKPTPH